MILGTPGPLAPARDPDPPCPPAAASDGTSRAVIRGTRYPEALFLAAGGCDRVAIAWTERADYDDPPVVTVAASSDGGRSFDAPRTVGPGSAPRVAIDPAPRRPPGFYQDHGRRPVG